ncbi:hypothetical protein [Pelagicoccus sp. SDUM812002]|uniref:hypothetical protein n=1 Tax=Pelagicoccus sp. SDUM812002 TaxID=3041266 RepID=UPI00280EF24F|nr:hypothetical protein [Pelagicoccus sp. SDUM812002]MDQ8186812.1 hypothetical protein [Pelagicoccus sp. SDUM812002]
MATYFSQDLRRSRQDTQELPLEQIIRGLFPDLISLQTSVTDREDISGTDALIRLSDDQRLKTDLKFRTLDPRRFGNDDLAVETWSVFEKKIPGYRGKQTDVLIWIFKDTHRAVAVPFHAYRKRVAEKRKMLLRTLPTQTQTTINHYGQSYESHHLFVPAWIFQDLIIEAHNPTQKIA